jgi:hypothetical protein
MNNKFFSLAEMKQPVNQWFCIAFLGLWCFWIVLYYTTNKAYDVGSNIRENSGLTILDSSK